MIIDGKDAILGRLSSFTAKKLLQGEEVTIINAEKAIITGNPVEIVKDYLKIREIGSPQHGPFFPKQPNMIVRRTIRSMLPYKTNKGRIAFRKLRVQIGNPDNQKGEQIAVKVVKSNYTTVGHVAKLIGWRQ